MKNWSKKNLTSFCDHLNCLRRCPPNLIRKEEKDQKKFVDFWVNTVDHVKKNRNKNKMISSIQYCNYDTCNYQQNEFIKKQELNFIYLILRFRVLLFCYFWLSKFSTSFSFHLTWIYLGAQEKKLFTPELLNISQGKESENDLLFWNIICPLWISSCIFFISSRGNKIVINKIILYEKSKKVHQWFNALNVWLPNANLGL